jgi:tRNA-splicing ligase RtcB
MMRQNLIAAVRTVISTPFEAHIEAFNCHHNYVQKERHFGCDVLVTCKSAVSARLGKPGIIPGSMGGESFIVRGNGNGESFRSVGMVEGAPYAALKPSGALRWPNRSATEGAECSRDASVIDEIPMASYKDIDVIMHAKARLGRSGAGLEASGVRQGMTESKSEDRI